MSAATDSVLAAAYELAYHEGQRVLDQQRVVIDAIRTGAGLLLSAAAIATSFLGGAALESGMSAAGWLAIGAFVLLGLGVVLILWPSQGQEQSPSPRLVIESYVEREALPLALIHRDLALHMDTRYTANRGYLERLIRLSRGCSLLLIVETLAWVLSLIVSK